MNLLDDIIDPQGEAFEDILRWVNSRIAAVHSTKFTPDVVDTFQPFEISEELLGGVDPEASPVWRRFFIATLLADWACYEREVDRVDFDRLKKIMVTAYRYFRLWMCRLPDGQWAPVGYSAWYPLAEEVYKGVLDKSLDIKDRGAFMPLKVDREEEIRYVYAFNISVIEELYNTPCSRQIVHAYQKDRKRLGDVGVVAVTVDEPGKELSRMCGFVHAGDLTVQGEVEQIFIKKSAN